MSKHITFLLFFVIEAFVILFAAEVLIHGFYYKKATDVSEFAVKTAENVGGFTPSVIDTVNYRMAQENIDHFTFTHTNSPKVNYGGTLETNVSGTYTYRTLNLLGTGVGNITVAINSPNIGYSNVWFRN